MAAVAALDDDVRRALYEYVRAARVPVTREAASAAVGISRKLAAFHLDKLVDLGVLRSALTSPGPRRVGRAPRVYEPAGADIAVHLPERTPEVLAAVLVDAATSHRPNEGGREAALRVAREHGIAAGGAARTRSRGGRIGVERATQLAHGVLAEHGFEPYRSADAIRLRNCPFRPLTARNPEFVCSLNRAYLEGVLDGIGTRGRIVAELAPRAGECCVEIRPA